MTYEHYDEEKKGESSSQRNYTASDMIFSANPVGGQNSIATKESPQKAAQEVKAKRRRKDKSNRQSRQRL